MRERKREKSRGERARGGGERERETRGREREGGRQSEEGGAGPESRRIWFEFRYAPFRGPGPIKADMS